VIQEVQVLQAPAKGFRFGEFALDAARACLRRGQVVVPLRPKSFALLEYLLTHAGRGRQG
jgi:DNA-binding response OmpR family regulator